MVGAVVVVELQCMQVYKRMCKRCGLVWQTEEVPERFGAFELRYAEKDCLRCRFPQRYRRPPTPESPLQTRLRQIRAMSVRQLTRELQRLGLAAADPPTASSPTVYSARFGPDQDRRARSGGGVSPTAASRRPPPAKAALVARLERHARREHGLSKAAPPPRRTKKPRQPRTRHLNQGISLQQFTGNAMRADWRRLEERAKKLLVGPPEGTPMSSRPKTIQEYQDEFVAQHIQMEAARERAATAPSSAESS